MVAQEQLEDGGRIGFQMTRVSHLENQLRQATRVRDRLRVKRARSAHANPVVGATGARSRESRGAAPGRRQGSRRSTGTGSRAGPSDDDGESEPPGPRLWRHPDFGPVSPNLYRLLIGEARS